MSASSPTSAIVLPLRDEPSGIDWPALGARWEAQGWEDEGYPAARVDDLRRAGALAAFARVRPGAETVSLLRALKAVGAADLSLGRVFEGHVNAAQLVAAYGSAAQGEALDRWLAEGQLMGVWNTEPAPGTTIARAGPGRWRLHGAKSFATGAGELDRILVTARDEAGAKRMVLVPVAGERTRADASGWRVRGMKGTVSGRYDFEGMEVGDEAVIGAPGDYEREPRFSAGAWRFCAVQLGGAEALARHLRDHLVASGKGADPVQRARFAPLVVSLRGAGAWVEQAAGLAEAADARAVPMVLMARGAVEEAALSVMEAAARSVGTASFFHGSPVDRITRDLGLYLRQPVPDQARDRAAAAWLEADRWPADPWW